MNKLFLFFVIYLSFSSCIAANPARYNFFERQKKQEAEGIGVEFKGPVKIIDDPEERDEKGIPVKKMYIWISNCKNVEIKDPEAFKKLKNGSWAAVKLIPESCTISGWRVF